MPELSNSPVSKCHVRLEHFLNTVLSTSFLKNQLLPLMSGSSETHREREADLVLGPFPQEE